MSTPAAIGSVAGGGLGRDAYGRAVQGQVGFEAVTLFSR
jgi:hypothetical protein